MAHTSTCAGCGEAFDYTLPGTGTIVVDPDADRDYCAACWPDALDAWLDDDEPEPVH